MRWSILTGTKTVYTGKNFKNLQVFTSTVSLKCPNKVLNQVFKKGHDFSTQRATLSVVEEVFKFIYFSGNGHTTMSKYSFTSRVTTLKNSAADNGSWSTEVYENKFVVPLKAFLVHYVFN